MILDLNFRLLARVVGMVTMAIGLGMIPSLIVSLLYREYDMAVSFCLSILAATLIGIILQLLKPLTMAFKDKDAFLIATLCWLVSSLAGAVPFLLSGVCASPIDAIFESTSGFTAVGASVLTHVEALPRGLLFWRSSTIWFGGMGILIFAVAILPTIGISGYQIAKAESPGPNMEKLTARTTDTAKILYLFYIAMTVTEILLLTLGGMPVFDAFIHSFGSIGTGGFSNYDNNIAHFNSTYIHIITMIFMLMGSFNFNWYYEIVKGRWQSLLKSSELRFYLCVIGIFTIGITVILRMTGYYNSLDTALAHGAFQVVSTATTTGYSLSDFDAWPLPAKLLLFMLFFMGGCTASTSGSLRALRILTLLKYLKRQFFLKIHTRAVLPIKLNGRPVPEPALNNMLYLTATFICTFVVGCILISLEGFDLPTTLTAVAGVLSTTGTGFGGVGSTIGYDIFSAGGKIILILLMLIARLELFTVIVLFNPYFWGRRKRA